MAEDFEIGGPPPEETSNRTFLYAAGGIGLLILISIGCLAGYALFLAPAQVENRAAQLTQIAAQNTQTSLEITQTAEARFPTPTTPPTPTVTALPVTGFADEGGFPSLLALAAVLVVVVIIARRMRMRPTV